jgi:hypothetical protein
VPKHNINTGDRGEIAQLNGWSNEGLEMINSKITKAVYLDNKSRGEEFDQEKEAQNQQKCNKKCKRIQIVTVVGME